MMQTISIARGARRPLLLLALAGAIGGCGPAEPPTATSEGPDAAGSVPALSSSYRGGIPFGTWALPTSEFNEVFNGAMRNIAPGELVEELAAIQARGGKVILSLAGKETNYLDNERFSLSHWKSRVDRYRDIDISEYLSDGTIIGHYLIDEPNDPANWGGVPVTGAMVETMAEYSKELWPGMATIVRAEPGYLGKTGGPYRYLDAAWAQYVVRKGTPKDYITRNVADAERLGLNLITGLNIRKGAQDRGEMSAGLVESAGLTLLESDYPCAFISWEYVKDYLERADVRQSMEKLSGRAASRPSKSCGSGQGGTPPPGDGDDDDDDDDADDGEEEPEEPENERPTAAFETPGCSAGAPCLFTDGSSDPDGSILTRSWDFGQGETSDQANPAITFARRGTYRVTLTVTDEAGASSSLTRQVRVSRGSLPSANPIVLSLTTYARDARQYVSLSWSAMGGASVDVYRNGVLREQTRNDRKYVRGYASRGLRTFTYQVCETGTTTCSNTVTAAIN